MQRHITKIFDILFLLLFKQFYITKKIRRFMPDFMDILYFVCKQNYIILLILVQNMLLSTIYKIATQ